MSEVIIPAAPGWFAVEWKSYEDYLDMSIDYDGEELGVEDVYFLYHLIAWKITENGAKPVLLEMDGPIKIDGFVDPQGRYICDGCDGGSFNVVAAQRHKYYVEKIVAR